MFYPAFHFQEGRFFFALKVNKNKLAASTSKCYNDFCKYVRGFVLTKK